MRCFYCGKRETYRNPFYNLDKDGHKICQSCMREGYTKSALEIIEHNKQVDKREERRGMNRYIDVDKLSEMIEARAETLVKGKEAFYYIANWLNKLPPADVVEIRQGKWKIEEYKNHLNVVCSNCNKEFYVYKQGQYRIDRSNYCPNCGAKMEGERKDEE